MTNHDEFGTFLIGIDTPRSPDPLFARRLRKQFLAESARIELIGSGTVIDLNTPRRSRLLDFAAVAILLLSMIGGMFGINSGRIGIPTPTVRAADLATPSATLIPTAIMTEPRSTESP